MVNDVYHKDQSIDQEILNWDTVCRRARMCTEAKGGHSEHLL